MTRITKEQYEYAQNRIEELLPIVDGNDLLDRNAIELSMLSVRFLRRCEHNRKLVCP